MHFSSHTKLYITILLSYPATNHLRDIVNLQHLAESVFLRFIQNRTSDGFAFVIFNSKL